MQPKGVSTRGTRGWERDHVRAWAGADQEKHRHMIIKGADGEKPFKANFYVKKYTEYSRIY